MFFVAGSWLQVGRSVRLYRLRWRLLVAGQLKVRWTRCSQSIADMPHGIFGDDRAVIANADVSGDRHTPVCGAFCPSQASVSMVQGGSTGRQGQSSRRVARSLCSQVESLAFKEVVIPPRVYTDC